MNKLSYLLIGVGMLSGCFDTSMPKYEQTTHNLGIETKGALLNGHFLTDSQIAELGRPTKLSIYSPQIEITDRLGKCTSPTDLIAGNCYLFTIFDKDGNIICTKSVQYDRNTNTILLYLAAPNNLGEGVLKVAPLIISLEKKVS